MNNIHQISFQIKIKQKEQAIHIQNHPNQTINKVMNRIKFQVKHHRMMIKENIKAQKIKINLI